MIALVVALLLGLRHATDPDHVTAVSTLVLSEERPGGRRAGMLGLAWGAGHAATLSACGLPLVLWGSHLPAWAERAAGVAIGLVIVALAVRLLLRVRDRARRDHHRALHDRRDAEGLGRSPVAAAGIGALHGLGGSAGVGVLLVGAMPSRGGAAVALAVFAAATALAMAAVSAAVGLAVGRERTRRPFTRLVPALGAASLAFGAWYALAAI